VKEFWANEKTGRSTTMRPILTKITASLFSTSGDILAIQDRLVPEFVIGDSFNNPNPRLLVRPDAFQEWTQAARRSKPMSTPQVLEFAGRNPSICVCVNGPNDDQPMALGCSGEASTYQPHSLSDFVAGLKCKGTGRPCPGVQMWLASI
jgi:hypothetical protein